MVKIRDLIFMNCIVKIEMNGATYKVRDRSDVLCFKVSRQNYGELMAQISKGSFDSRY
ncbi:MAG: hypothetical protein ACKOE6_01885 [Flammeovirgaceae bacterium]